MQIDTFTRRLTDRCRKAFGARLVYLGLSGSYARGEAHADSDIDIHMILDELAPSDLDVYRTILKEMPQGERACGFVGDKAVLAAWPAHEMFQFTMGSRTLFGSLEGIAPSFRREDLQNGIRLTASGLYHMAVHGYLFESQEAAWTDSLNAACKTACFALQELWYLKTGQYVPRRNDLAACFTGVYRAVIERCLRKKGEAAPADNEETAILLLACSRLLLQETAKG